MTRVAADGPWQDAQPDAEHSISGVECRGSDRRCDGRHGRSSSRPHGLSSMRVLAPLLLMCTDGYNHVSTAPQLAADWSIALSLRSPITLARPIFGLGSSPKPFCMGLWQRSSVQRHILSCWQRRLCGAWRARGMRCNLARRLFVTALCKCSV
eukprot:365694-Chlamydomonas_euryale.AAC.3